MRRWIKVSHFALCAIRFATESLGYSFPEGGSLPVQFAEAISFGKVFNFDNCVTHRSNSKGHSAEGVARNKIKENIVQRPMGKNHNAKSKVHDVKCNE